MLRVLPVGRLSASSKRKNPVPIGHLLALMPMDMAMVLCLAEQSNFRVKQSMAGTLRHGL